MQGTSDTTSDNIGDALLARRKQRRLDQGRAASEIGVSPSTYRSYEKNTQRPSVNVFPALSKFLGLEIEDFLPLYAATVIFALRPALERELASLSNGSTGDGARVGETEPLAVSSAEEQPLQDYEEEIIDEIPAGDEEESVGEPEEKTVLSSADEQVFRAVDEPSTNGSFASEELEDVEEVDEDDEDDGEEEVEEDEFDEVPLVSVMAHEEVMAKPTISQYTSVPSNFEKSTKQKKKKKKNKKR
jgi:transcriptional regulator with XRE-family HTH domain